MKCIVGLGNPGRKYANTRHNVGYMVLREIAGRIAVSFAKDGFSERGTGKVHKSDEETETVLLLRPLTYMNLSGQAVLEAVRDYGLTPEDILVVHDDLDIPFGKIRVRRKGSSGGHRGVESIAAYLETNCFPRLKVGIGRPPEGVEPVDFVLMPFGRSDARVLDEAIGLAASAALDVIAQGVDYAMSQYNGSPGSTLDGEEK